MHGIAARRVVIVVAAVVIAAALLAVVISAISTSSSSSNEMTLTSKPSGSAQPQVSFKVLHIMSYHSPWEWTDNQLAGFQNALGGLNVEYKVFQMNTKRDNSPEWLEKARQQALGLVDQWKPDLVFSSDDDAQIYACQYLAGKSIPLVFCGVNADPADYGYVGKDNVTGVLEREHFVQSVSLLKRLVPGVKKIAVVSDTGAMWKKALERIDQSRDQLDGVELVKCEVLKTYAEYKSTILRLQNEVDAVGFLGVFEFTDENGKNVRQEEVMKWTLENSSLPDFTFWEDRAHKGTLCTVTASAYEQGHDAGRLARAILEDGASPSRFPMKAALKGQPFISLARAKRLGIVPPSDLLLACQVVEDITWGE